MFDRVRLGIGGLFECPTEGQDQRSATPPADAGQPATDAGTAPSDTNSGGTYPYGTAQTGAAGGVQQPKAAAEGDTVVMAPDGSVWVHSGGLSPQYQSDMDSCYGYARGQIEHDARIENDVNAAFQSEASGLGLTALRGRMNNYERSQRLPSLFNSCMVAKGYNRQ